MALPAGTPALPPSAPSSAPRFASVALSFAVIGLYWISHHRRFRYIKRYDEGLLWLNLLLLACVVFLPFATELIGTHPDDKVSIVTYGLGLSAAGFASVLMWVYASHDYRLINREDVTPEAVKRATVRILAPPVVFLLATGVAFVHTELAKVLFYLPIPIYLGLELIRRRDTRRVERREGAREEGEI